MCVLIRWPPHPTQVQPMMSHQSQPAAQVSTAASSVASQVLQQHMLSSNAVPAGASLYYQQPLPSSSPSSQLPSAPSTFVYHASLDSATTCDPNGATLPTLTAQPDSPSSSLTAPGSLGAFPAPADRRDALDFLAQRAAQLSAENAVLRAVHAGGLKASSAADVSGMLAGHTSSSFLAAASPRHTQGRLQHQLYVARATDEATAAAAAAAATEAAIAAAHAASHAHEAVTLCCSPTRPRTPGKRRSCSASPCSPLLPAYRPSSSSALAGIALARGRPASPTNHVHGKGWR
jgi:hypothetical protein